MFNETEVRNPINYKKKLIDPQKEAKKKLKDHLLFEGVKKPSKRKKKKVNKKKKNFNYSSKSSVKLNDNP